MNWKPKLEDPQRVDYDSIYNQPELNREPVRIGLIEAARALIIVIVWGISEAFHNFIKDKKLHP
jgi:hypothetical protein